MALFVAEGGEGGGDLSRKIPSLEFKRVVFYSHNVLLCETCFAWNNKLTQFLTSEERLCKVPFNGNILFN